MRTKLLILLRAGAGSVHRAWTQVCASRVDVAISLYDDSPIDAADFVASHRCPGGKYRGLAAFLADHAWVIDAYTHFWCFEDDLYLPYESLLAVQDMIERYDFALCAPSLTPESFVSWTLAVQNTAFCLRATDFVEIMAPIMSRGFLQRALPHFAENHTGWGYEWLWRRTLDEMGTFAAILDAAPIVHTRPLGTGVLYDSQSGDRIEGVQEAAALFHKFGIVHDGKPFRNHFGLSRAGRRLVYGSDFLLDALAGYAALRTRDPALHERCRQFLIDSPRPLASLEDILRFKGADLLLSAGP